MKSVVLQQSTDMILPRRRVVDRRALGDRLVFLAFLTDALVIVGMMLLAWVIRFATPLEEYGPIAAKTLTLREYSGHIGFGAALMALLLVNFNAYPSQRLLSFGASANAVVKASLAWLVAFLAISLILKFDPPISRFYGVISFVMLLLGLLTWRRIFSRLMQRESLAAKLRQRAVIVGWTEECEGIVKRLGRGQGHPYEILGVVEPETGFGRDLPSLGVPILGTATEEELRRLLESHAVEVVLVPDGVLPREAVTDLADLCEKHLVAFKIVPSCFQILLSGLHLEAVAGVPLLGVTQLPLHSAFNQACKRLLDIVGAIIGLLLSAPLLVIFGYLVWREDRGPIFYKQVRTGRNGRRFQIYKIRSMRLDSEADGKGARWAKQGDPRCLRIGAFMRRWNIDEIPQFWNVLTGEMSLVGPRPERPELIAKFREIIPHYNARHDIKPGITGWAQVCGFRGDTDLTERIKHDLYYIENWNLLLDLQIMAMTFVRRENAY